MGDYIQNAESGHHHQVQADGSWLLMDSEYSYHYGAAGIGPVVLPRVSRSVCLALRAAAVTSQAALDVAIINSPLAQAYAALVYQADQANVPALHHPRKGVRAWALSLVDLPVTPSN